MSAVRFRPQPLPLLPSQRQCEESKTEEFVIPLIGREVAPLYTCDLGRNQSRNLAVKLSRCISHVLHYNVSGENMAATTLKRGHGVTAVHQHIARIQAGLSYRAVENLQRALHIPLETMASVLGMSRATLHRRKNQGKIDRNESERLVRYQRLLEKADGVFGDVASAREWLTHKQPGLGGAVPLDFARTEIGAREVENLLGRIEYGVYS